MATTKQRVLLQLLEFNSEPSQYKPMNVQLGSIPTTPVLIAFEVDSKEVIKADPNGMVALTPKGMADIAAQWYKTISAAKLAADKELSKGGD